MKWRLERTQQCAKCPWKVSTNPNDIPNGYDPQKHANLKSTIAPEDPIRALMEAFSSKKVHAMACHKEHETPCIGWLMNQLGPGNNIALRIHARQCENLGDVQLDGPQHKRFEDTLPPGIREATCGVPDTLENALKPITTKPK